MIEADLGPMPVVKRFRTHELEPGMFVRPRGKDGSVLDSHRWIVGRVAGAFTMAHRGLGKLQYREQYWATDTLVPVRRKGSKEVMRVTDALRRKAKPIPAPKPMAVAQAKDVQGKPTDAPRRHEKKGSRPPDSVAELLAPCKTLDDMLVAAAGAGYPDCDTLRGRISHLSPGLQRMNVGNRLRSFLSSAP